MRIIEFCTSESLGGLELYFVNCCKQLQARGHDIVAVIKDDSKVHNRLEGKVPSWFYSKSLFNNYLLYGKIKEWRPDFIHIHAKKDLLFTVLLKRLFISKFKLVFTGHMNMPRSKRNIYHDFFYKKIDLALPITFRLKTQMLANTNIPERNLKLLYHGVPLFPVDKDRFTDLRLDNNKFKIAVIGRIHRKKEQHILIEAINKLSKSRQEKIQAFLIGGTPDKEYVNVIESKLKELMLNEVITITGFKENPQQIMPFFDTVILTTGDETFGLVLPEAMRMRVAVIGANGGGVPEIIDHEKTGLLFEPGDPEDLGKKIIQLMNNELRDKLALQGKQKADKLFRLENHFDKLEDILKQKLHLNSN